MNQLTIHRGLIDLEHHALITKTYVRVQDILAVLRFMHMFAAFDGITEIASFFPAV